MWIIKFENDEAIYVGFYKPDGRRSFPFRFGLSELQDAIRLVNYLNGGNGDPLDIKIDME